MVRLTADFLLRAENYLNPLLERELNLRGFKIGALENLAVLQDQFDVIDFTDNEIRILDNFPRMKRLSSLMVAGNYISRIGKIGDNLPSLSLLNLSNNKISQLSEIEKLSSCKALQHLSLLENAVTMAPNYRLFAIHRLPTLKSLDFRRVTRTEVEQARVFFASHEGMEMLSVLARESGSSNAVSEAPRSGAVAEAPIALTEEQKVIVRQAINNATTKEEMENIEKQLRNGTFEFGDAV